jgi:hypothetical protein
LEDSAVRTPEAKARYSHLYDVCVWLSCHFGFVFKTKDISVTKMLVGSNIALLRQLQELNARTWQATPGILHVSP